jgi:hypothetical protein
MSNNRLIRIIGKLSVCLTVFLGSASGFAFAHEPSRESQPAQTAAPQPPDVSPPPPSPPPPETPLPPLPPISAPVGVPPFKGIDGEKPSEKRSLMESDKPAQNTQQKAPRQSPTEK